MMAQTRVTGLRQQMAALAELGSSESAGPAPVYASGVGGPGDRGNASSF